MNPPRNPPDLISKKEVVGRRAFGSKVFDQSDGAVVHYKVNVFLDKAVGEGLSVDRLGMKTAEEERIRFLKPLGERIADNGKTTFQGWAQIQASDIHSLLSKTEAVGEINPFHAEIDRSGHDNLEALRSFAFRMCVHASKLPFLECPADEAA